MLVQFTTAWQGKIGAGCQINSPHLNDAGSVVLGDDVVIGGNAIINAHLVEKGELVMAPVKLEMVP